MDIIIDNIIVSPDCPIDEVFAAAAKKAGVSPEAVKSKKIIRRSVDARKSDVRINYCVLLSLLLTKKIKLGSSFKEAPKEQQIDFPACELPYRPYIVGTGPAGLFAGYYLAKCGARPILLERGAKVHARRKAVETFEKSGVLNPDCNVQFGEGGAGTFSDGKLTTRIGDKLCGAVLDIFHRHGAPDDILYLAKPHIGTDVLTGVIASMRAEIERLGGEVHFGSRLEDIGIKNGCVERITVNGVEHDCSCLILAIGHSARDTYEMLIKKGVCITAKPFAVGVRIEHKQQFINDAQYGKFSGHPMLGAADYRLTYNGNSRSCFSFCMCPGGTVVAAASEQGGVAVNGMSRHARDGVNANSALVVSVNTNDFSGVLGGIEFQRKYERAAYSLGLKGGNFYAPIQQTVDFLEGKVFEKNSHTEPSYPIGTVFADLSLCLPQFVTDTLADGIRSFDSKIKGFAKNSVLTGVETRTSAPVRLQRSDKMESVNVKGLFPIGEGAGYAGGIMSSAVDGLKAGIALTEHGENNGKGE